MAVDSMKMATIGPRRRLKESSQSSDRDKRCSVPCKCMAIAAVGGALLLLSQGLHVLTIASELEFLSHYIKWSSSSRATNLQSTDFAVTGAPSNIPFHHPNNNRTRSVSSIQHDASETQNHLPSLSTLIGDTERNIIGNVSFILNFAIIGHVKCGTTTFLQWMQDHIETLVIPDESYALRRDRPAALVHTLYHLQPKRTNSSNSINTTLFLPNITYQRGYKSPNDIEGARSRHCIRTYFPNTKLIVGIRHPILWFQSLYNFRVQNKKTTTMTTDTTNATLMPHPNQLMVCHRIMKNTCTDLSLFHVSLAKLGKTNLTQDELQDSFRNHRHRILNKGRPPDRMPNPVFLYETAQLKIPTSTSSQQEHQRSLQFRRDVQSFLGLHYELPPIPHSLPDRVWEDPHAQAFRDSQKIDICHEEYVPVRTRLLEQAREASMWIRKYFLDAPGVFVSSRDHLEELLERWMHDPCSSNAATLPASRTKALNSNS